MTTNDPDSQSNGDNHVPAPAEDEKMKPILSRGDRQGSHVSKGKEAAATAAPAPKKPGRMAKMGFTPIDLPTFLIMVK